MLNWIFDKWDSLLDKIADTIWPPTDDDPWMTLDFDWTEDDGEL